MKSGITLLIILFLAISVTEAQETKKQDRERRKAEAISATESLIKSGRFIFVGRFAMPTGMNQVNLASNPNYVKFTPEMIESQMPFFGQAYSTTGYGTDTGAKFKGKPEKYFSKKGKKGWDVEAEVSDHGDNYKVFISVSPSGSALLSITSNRRSTISYSGDIIPLEEGK